MHKDVLFAIMDCNVPDVNGGMEHAQLVKTKHKITGQHKSVDIVSQYLPDTSITIVSSLDRFKTIVRMCYRNKHNMYVNFICKSSPVMSRKTSGPYLRQYLKLLN